MCDIGKMFSGGSLGGILGGLAGTGLSIFAPELGIPLALATGLGSGAGTFLGDVASGKSAGDSILPSLESGALSGGLAGLGNVAAGGSFFGTPASSITNFFGSTPTDAASTAGTLAAPVVGSDPAAAAIGSTVASAANPTAAIAPATTLASTTPATVGAAAGAPAAGGGAAIGDVSTALPAATGGAGSAGANLGGSAIGSGGAALTGPTGALGPSGAVGPTSLTAGLDNTPGAWIPGVNTAGATDVGGQVPGVSGGSSGGSFLSRIFGGGGGTTTPTTVTDAAGNITDISGGGGGGAGGGSFLSRGLVGNQGSLISDLTKPSTLITGGAALLPLLQGNTIPGLSNLQNQAASFNAMGTPLAQSLQTGNLPAGAQTSLDAATRAAKAAVRSQYANMGLSGSSQEADQLAGVDAKEATQKVAMLEDLTKIGVGEMGQATPILQNIMTARLAQDQQQQQAIARLAAALAGSTGTEKTTA
jgi:hypothetical protein